MREIKFRGRIIGNGNWTYGDLIQLVGDQGKGRKFIVNNRFGACFDSEGNFINTESPFVCEVDPETIGQYTGLKNRPADTELYEGDIVVPNGSCGGISVQPYAMPRKYATGEKFIISHLPCGWALRHISAFGKIGFDTPNSIIHGWKIIESCDLWNHQGQMDVIGNIYEHPHLLPEKEKTK